MCTSKYLMKNKMVLSLEERMSKLEMYTVSKKRCKYHMDDVTVSLLSILKKLIALKLQIELGGWKRSVFCCVGAALSLPPFLSGSQHTLISEILLSLQATFSPKPWGAFLWYNAFTPRPEVLVAVFLFSSVTGISFASLWCSSIFVFSFR